MLRTIIRSRLPMTPFSHLHDALKTWIESMDWGQKAYLTVALWIVDSGVVGDRV
ncbi:MAG: hypothetical protein F6K09_26295 [Merismopedia sp. SIO2A8]|nr:hypothetical protein [Merismopedia sp. SIO2A8]